MSEKNGGGNRDWGYASYDEDGNLIYTSYEKSGSVNRYHDNGDGGHGHAHWKSKDDYNSGKDADFERVESNSSPNPSTGEVQDKGGCYLTSACMKQFSDQFDDNCYELRVLRWFRDNFVSKIDIKKYYESAPVIVNNINQDPNSRLVYDYIYENIINPCLDAIEIGDYELAYSIYRNNVKLLTDNFIEKGSTKKLVISNPL